ncbi:MAG: hypothetical protein RIR01_160 [Bacteroidota bacterium]|jgi:hypothetical protein
MKKSTNLKDKLDKVFSLYIRLRDADENGFCTCYTCGKVAHYKEMQNGHFWSRTHLSTRFNENNCKVQCVGCNIFKKGNYIEYTKRLLKELGEEKFNELERLKNSTVKISKTEYEQMIEHYNQKIKEYGV